MRILGGNSSSRLFVRIREELGLAYSVSANDDDYWGNGTITLFVATSNKNIPLAMQEMRKIVDEVGKNGFTQKELEMAKNKMNTNIQINKAKHSNKKRMSFNAYDEFFQSKRRTDEMLVKMINAVTLEQINDFAKKIAKEKNYVIGALGKNISEEELKEYDKAKKNLK